MGETREERLEAALRAFAPYFTSGNEVPVERATIKADSEAVRLMWDALLSEPSEPEGGAEDALEQALNRLRDFSDSMYANSPRGHTRKRDVSMVRRALRQLKGYAETIRIVRRELGLPDDSPDGGNDLRRALRQRVPEVVRRLPDELRQMADRFMPREGDILRGAAARIDRAIAQEESDG